MNILVTGASGFLGSALLTRLLSDPDLQVSIAVRRRLARPDFNGPQHVVTDFSAASDAATDWSSILGGVGVVVHCAARVHVMNETSGDPLQEFRAVNVDGTLNLARHAAAAGVRRFVYISSLKVNGEATLPGVAFSADTVPAPLDPYGISKHEAEQGLRQLAQETNMEVVILRPPLVYGPGVRANFAALLNSVARRIPLPLGAVHNRRSLVGLDNLVDLITVCITHKRAANETFLVSDGQDLSTTELIRAMADALQVRARLLPIPAALLVAAATLFGKRDVIQRVCGNLQADISKTKTLLDWNPPVSVAEGLRRTAAVIGRKH